MIKILNRSLIRRFQ